MRRLFLVSWLAIVGLTVCGGVLAARKADCPAAYKAALVRDLARLPPVEDLPLAAGRIVAVNEQAGTLTVRHGAIPRYELDPMTRVFRIADRAQLAGLTPGDKIRFDLVRKDGRYVIDHLENSN
jgi:Cu/Ag efflux protein CusF